MAKPRHPGAKTLNAADILLRIEQGDSYMQIASDLGCSRATIYDALSLADPSGDNSARAQAKSAEAWLDKGLAAISSALSKSGDVDASAARAYAQECARRAAIRNPAYRDKQDHTVSAPGGGPVVIELVAPGKVSSGDTEATARLQK